MLDILFLKNFLNLEESHILFNYLMTNCNFKVKTVNYNGVENLIPRLIHWYGDYSYYYSGVHHPSSPLPFEIQELSKKISQYLLLEKNIDSVFNSVLINYYRNGLDKIGMHGDDLTQLGENPIIASISLGESRILKMQNNNTKEIQKFLLENGDLFIMKGNTQDTWKHGINPEANKGPRINLTFRNLKYPPK